MDEKGVREALVAGLASPLQPCQSCMMRRRPIKGRKLQGVGEEQECPKKQNEEPGQLHCDPEESTVGK